MNLRDGRRHFSDYNTIHVSLCWNKRGLLVHHVALLPVKNNGCVNIVHEDITCLTVTQYVSLCWSRRDLLVHRVALLPVKNNGFVNIVHEDIYSLTVTQHMCHPV